MSQLYNIASLPVLFGHIAVMPDVHLGKGATVGSVVPTQRAIIPAAVGVDTGCGMNAIRLSLKASDLPDNLRGLRTAIEAVVPVGFNQHKKEVAKNSTIRALSKGLEPILEKHKKLNTRKNKPFTTWVKQLGSLGGGNHFIELYIFRKVICVKS